MDSVLLDSYLSSICNNTADTIKAIGSYVIIIVGLVLIIVSVIQIVQGFLANGKAAWFMTFGCLLYGGFLIFGGWVDITQRFGGTGKATIDNIMGNMMPTTHEPLTSTASTGSGIDTTRNAIGVLSDSLFMPAAKALAVSVGVILVVMASTQIASYFMKKGKAQISFGKVFAMAVLGSVLFTATPTDNSAGWKWIVNTAVGATYDTVIGVTEGHSTGQTAGINVPVAKTEPKEPTDEATKEI